MYRLEASSPIVYPDGHFETDLPKLFPREQIGKSSKRVKKWTHKT